MKPLFLIFFLFTLLYSRAQYPFEKYPALKYSKYEKWKTWEKGENIHKTILIPKFFNNGDSLIIQLTNFESLSDSSIIRLYRNNHFIQKTMEPPPPIYIRLEDTIYTADINGDGLMDIKLNAGLSFNGIPWQKRIYSYQNPDTSFTKISFEDIYMFETRTERDFNNDNNFEIITNDFNGFEDHNYWTFNIYNFVDNDFICVNDLYNYPIMIQLLIRTNFTETTKISKEQMKKFSNKFPYAYDRRK